MGMKINLFLAILLTFILAFQAMGDPDYDCHRYAWGPGEIKAKRVEKGDFVIYFKDGEPVHSAKYLGHGWAISKWGKNPIMIHPLWLSPYGLEYYFYEKV